MDNNFHKIKQKATVCVNLALIDSKHFFHTPPSSLCVCVCVCVHVHASKAVNKIDALLVCMTVQILLH